MAQVAKVRRLVNPAKKRRNASSKRRLTTAQKLAGFGGKRAQSAAKASAKRSRAAKKAAATRKRTTTAAPRRAKATTAKPAARKRRVARPKRSNPTEIIQLGLANPAPRRKAVRRKRKTTARRRATTRRNPAPRARRATRRNPVSRRRTYRRRRNPVVSARRRRRTYRRNPATARVGGLMKQAVYLVGGAVGARAVTQMVLKSKNVGPTGYIANAVAAFALGGVASKVMKSKAIGQAVTLGGFVGITLRLLQDFTPLGGYVNQQLAMSGMSGDSGMGFLQPSTFFVPLVPADGRGADNAQMALPAAVQPPAPANLNGLAHYGSGDSRMDGGRY